MFTPLNICFLLNNRSCFTVYDRIHRGKVEASLLENVISWKMKLIPNI